VIGFRRVVVKPGAEVFKNTGTWLCSSRFGTPGRNSPGSHSQLENGGEVVGDEVVIRVDVEALLETDINRI
jgi:hypothetical protein